MKQIITRLSRRLKEGHSQLLDLENSTLSKKTDVPECKHLQTSKCQFCPHDFLKHKGVNREMIKSLLELNFSLNSPKAIRLFTLDFYEAIHVVDGAKS